MEQSLPDRVIDLACAIQQIASPTFAELQRAAFVEQRFLDEGLSMVSRDTLGNVYACLPGKKSVHPLIVSAHLDTVFPANTDLTLSRYPDKIVGPGIGDNSLGLAALFGLAWSLRDLSRDVWLVANVGEEGLGNLRGIKAAVDRFGRDVSAYIVVEGMSLGQVYHVGLGVQRYRITVQTPGGHAWVDYGKPSAIHELAELAVKISHISLPDKPRTSMNIGVIQGGTSINTIAAEAFFELDLRSEEPQALASVASQVEKLVKTAQKPGTDPVRASADIIGQRPAGYISYNHPLVVLAAKCLQEQGITARLNTGSTDANCPLSYGIPAVCVGVTTGGGAHTINEYINVQPVEVGLRQLKMLVERSCGLLG
jgi:acetylornithine deacetylase/succinyl-diaminopimelate desuccinylase-like protein